MPAAKSMAAAPSTASLPPPQTSCRLASANPPPGSRSSMSGTPKGSTARSRAVRPSNCRMRSRRSATTAWAAEADIGVAAPGFEKICSLFVLKMGESQSLSRMGKITV
jgi:hypothetical protein